MATTKPIQYEPGKPIKVFLASPGDVPEERAFVRDHLREVLPNTIRNLTGGEVAFDVVSWDDMHAPLTMPAHLTPQEAVIQFKGAPRDCDIVIVIVASRLGTHLSLDTFKKPDGTGYQSGTEWEFLDAWTADPRPLIFVFRRMVFPTFKLSDRARRRKMGQFALVQAFFATVTNPDGSGRGAYQTYTSLKDFETKFRTAMETILPILPAPPEPIPQPGPGLHLGIGPDGVIHPALLSDIDADGSNIRRIRDLLPLIRQAAGDLATALTGTNAFVALKRDLQAYRTAISEDVQNINWGLVWGLGVTVETTADSVDRDYPNRLGEALEDEPHAALERLRILHSSLITATADGRVMQADADRLRMTQEAQAALKQNAQAVTDELGRSKELREPGVAATASRAVSGIGEGPHPERGTTFGITTVKNLLIVTLGAGTATAAIAGVTAFSGPAAPAVTPAATLAAYEVLKNTPMFKNGCAALGTDIHDMAHSGITGLITVRDRLAPFRSFVIRTEAPLREIARLTPNGRWMLRYIDFIVKTNGQN